MNTMTHPGPLEVRLSDELGISAEVAELLRERDMYAEPAYTGRSDLLLVRDIPGAARRRVMLCYELT